MISNDAVVLGLLFLVLYAVLRGAKSSHPFLKKFFLFVPPLLLCYFIPALLNTSGLVNGEESKLYFVASRYFLPASLVLLAISVDLREIIKLGPKALIMFFTGSIGVVVGGPIALWICSKVAPDVITAAGADNLWRGLSTIAGSWIGGGANQAAMKEIFLVPDETFSSMVTVDIVFADAWMAVILLGIGVTAAIDRFNRADSSAIESLKKKMEGFQRQEEKNPTSVDYFKLCAVAFGVCGFGHFSADIIAPFISQHFPGWAKFGLASGFFWLISVSTIVAILLSFTPLRKIEGIGASKIANLFIMILVATIGMHMNVLAIFDNPGLFLIGGIWILVHILLLLIVAKLIRAPFFYVAVGSQANIGGAASAPIIASAFHPALAPVGALLAILGYAVGTYLAWVCALLMKAVV
ncbi:DUF819 family protein [bacterium]|nr:DUF819 family protein [bacterium]